MSAAGYHPEVDAAIDAVVSASYGIGPSPFERAVVRLLGMLTKHRPAPLTVEEARAWALREVREYSGADSNYPWLALRLETALLAASRGEVPSEVRASTCPTCRGGAMVRAEGYDRDGFPHEEPCPTCCKPEVRAPERPNAFGEALGRMHRPGAIPPEVRAPQTPGPPAGEMAVTVGEELPGFADPVDVPPVLTPEEVRRADKIKRLGETIDSLRAQLRTYDFRGANPVHWRGLLEQLAIAEKALASAPRSEEKGVCLPDKEQPK